MTTSMTLFGKDEGWCRKIWNGRLDKLQVLVLACCDLLSRLRWNKRQLSARQDVYSNNGCLSALDSLEVIRTSTKKSSTL